MVFWKRVIQRVRQKKKKFKFLSIMVCMAFTPVVFTRFGAIKTLHSDGKKSCFKKSNY